MGVSQVFFGDRGHGKTKTRVNPGTKCSSVKKSNIPIYTLTFAFIK